MVLTKRPGWVKLGASPADATNNPDPAGVLLYARPPFSFISVSSQILMVLTKRPGWVKLGRRPLTSLVLGTGESGPQIDAGSCPGWVPRVAACERESQNLDLYAGSAGDVSWLVGSGWKEAVVEIVYARVAGSMWARGRSRSLFGCLGRARGNEVSRSESSRPSTPCCNR